ncbi:MAG: hypothetical protein ACOCV8_03200, partial [Spirochaetota bacterium]
MPLGVELTNRKRFDLCLTKPGLIDCLGVGYRKERKEKNRKFSYMSKIINTIIVIIILLTIISILAYFEIKYTIELMHYNDIPLVSIEDIEEGKINRKYIKLKNVVAYYYYAIKTYNTLSTPDEPTAIYFPIAKKKKATFMETLEPKKKFKIIVRDEDYDIDIINEKREMTLRVLGFKAKIINEIPKSVLNKLKSNELKKYFDDNLYFLDKSAKPMP